MFIRIFHPPLVHLFINLPRRTIPKYHRSAPYTPSLVVCSFQSLLFQGNRRDQSFGPRYSDICKHKHASRYLCAEDEALGTRRRGRLGLQSYPYRMAKLHNNKHSHNISKRMIFCLDDIFAGVADLGLYYLGNSNDKNSVRDKTTLPYHCPYGQLMMGLEHS